MGSRHLPEAENGFDGAWRQDKMINENHDSRGSTVKWKIPVYASLFPYLRDRAGDTCMNGTEANYSTLIIGRYVK
jgi:hypothetical protein